MVPRKILPLLLLLCAGCAGTAPPDPAHPAAATGWAETRLFFGLRDLASHAGATDPAAGDPAQAEARWRGFLDRTVTPLFPDGFSVIDAYGQWQGPADRAPQRLASKMLVIEAPDDSATQAKIAAIRSAWKALTGDVSVLRVTQAVDVSF